MRVAIGEEVIKSVANEIGFISSEGDRGSYVARDKIRLAEARRKAGLAIFLKSFDLSSPLNAGHECRSGIKRGNARITRMDKGRSRYRTSVPDMSVADWLYRPAIPPSR